MAKYYNLLLFFLSFIGSHSSAIHAAEISNTPNQEMHCYLSLRGEIEPGDADKIRNAMANFSSDHPEDKGLFYPNSMNSWKKVCFDSAGGSFSEGIKIAQYLLDEQIGSAVPRNAQCLSACAIAFMGGTNDTKMDGGNVIFRQLHPLGKLGFHAPFIEVPAREYSEKIVQQAYEGALLSVSLLLERGDEIKFPRSLLFHMLQTPSEDMLFVDTVGKASRWGIGIAPVIPRDTLDPVSAVNACYNQEAYLQDHPIRISIAPSDVIMQKGNVAGDGILPYGFRGELTEQCRIFSHKKTSYEQYGPLTYRGIHWIGDDNSGIYAYQMYDPLTPISTLVSINDEPPSRTPQLARRTFFDAACLVIENGQISDREPCQWEIIETRAIDLSLNVGWHFHWPSGSETIVSTGLDPEQPTLLNGLPAHLFDASVMPDSVHHAIEEASQDLLTSNNEPLTEFCWLNDETNRAFCFGSFSSHYPPSIEAYWK